jgi:hypothetical protein
MSSAIVAVAGRLNRAAVLSAACTPAPEPLTVRRKVLRFSALRSAVSNPWRAVR